MRHVVLSSFKTGFKKVGMNHLLRDHARLMLAQAKAVVDRLLAGEEVTLEVGDENVEDFVAAAQQLGAEARVTDRVAPGDAHSPARA